MSQPTQADMDSIMTRARRAAKAKNNNWPGLPMAQIKTYEHTALQVMINNGLVRLVDVSNISPLGTPREIRYVVPTGK